MPHDALPRREQPLSAWCLRLAERVLAEAPDRFGVPLADATEFAALAQSFADRLAIVADPARCTIVARAAKNDARRRLEPVARRVARVVTAHSGMSDPVRVELGLNLRERPAARRLPAPTARPHASIDVYGRVRVWDPARRASRTRPPGTWAALVFVKIGGDEPPRSPDDCFLAAVTARPTVTLKLPAAALGQRIWTCARYASERGDLGPPGPAAGALYCRAA